jgi:hypothetical protein
MKREKERITRSGILPNAQQTILLKACLLNGSDSIEAFHQWLKIVDIRSTIIVEKSALGLPQFFDQLDLGSQRLLSMLYKNMSANKANHPLIPKLEGYYKYVWYRNQMLMAEFRKLADLLSNQEIEVILRKGLYMTMKVYKDFGTRPTVDIDIAVRKGDWIKTVLVLESNGWKAKYHLDPCRISLSQFHACPFVKNDLVLDLHYDFVNYELKDETKKQIWSNLNTTGGFNGLSKSNEVYLTLIHGFTPNVISPIRWVIDSVLLFRQFDEVEWSNFIKLLEVEKKKSVLVMLEYLQSSQLILFPARIQELLRLQGNLKFDLLERTMLTKYHLNNCTGFIRLVTRIFISNSRSYRKSLIKAFDHYLCGWGKRYYIEVILHAIMIFPNKVFNHHKNSLNK